MDPPRKRMIQDFKGLSCVAFSKSDFTTKVTIYATGL